MAPTTSLSKVPGSAKAPGKPSLASEEEVSGKVALLRNILLSGNDNDPRLDSEFRDLTESSKDSLRGFYRKLPADRANERGTVVFLLGREIRGKVDLAFLNDVLAEPLSLRPKEEEHAGFSTELLSAYPQLMAVRALSKIRIHSPDPELRMQAEAYLKIAAQNPSHEISQRAQLALKEQR